MINIIPIIADILKVPTSEITEHTSMETQPLWDSLSHIEIITTLEKKLAIEFTGEEIIAITNVSKMHEIINAKLRTSLET